MSKNRPAESKASTDRGLPAVTLSPRGVSRVKSGHPWVYRSDISAASDIPPGATVRVLDPRGKFLGTALYSSSSQIAIRMIAGSDAEITDLPSLVSDRIRAAIAYRRQFVSNTDAYRVVFSEADFLPGLIIDKYNDVLSLQILTQAMDAEPVRGAIIQTLIEQFTPAGIFERVDPRIRELEQLPPRQSGLLWGKKSETIITMNASSAMERRASSPGESLGPKAESQVAQVRVPVLDANLGLTEEDGVRHAVPTSGIRFHFNALEGQKTGAFLDQRENYAAAARYARGDALDVFCYQGGFALHVAPHCSTVTGVDSSRPALEMADKNAALNQQLLNGKEIDWIEGNAFDLLRDYAASGQRYDTIVLDPPAFAKTKRDLPKALSGYKELNLRALKMLRPGGILVTCSCSFHVSSSDFTEVVTEAARDVHRSLRLLENRRQAQDHPILLNVPETGYLKCLILYASS
jgi:23S rRNA (cytosine1962-C5)-methyltransferase